MPIKRHKALQPFSREHHHSLLLSWKIRAGISKYVPLERIKKYSDWFFESHILPHFELEENFIFPILGKEHPLVRKALAEHRRLKRLFKETENLTKSLGSIEEELVAHIRFEERVLFQEIQNHATEKQLEIIQTAHEEEKFVENTEDEFWK